ncbi:MAG: HU family DNA-binding protein [Burkholderiaceae bacterium]|nr:HU family DNA-binding protein [Rhodoferax sp.]MCP5283315.1 HU family DNA-binding protein [Burkholderiaceae bacterium]
MATAKKAAAPAKKAAKAAPAKKAAAPAKKAAAAPKAAAKAAAPKAAPKAIKTVFNKTSLAAHLAELAAVEVKHVKSVLASLESTIAASLSKKGLGSFTMPGLFKINVNHVPAKKARKGIDPFTKQERTFAAKPASVKVKVRPMKKLKDAASS